MSKKLVTSDTHLFHRSIRDFCPHSRFGKDEHEMNALIKKQWNTQVAPNDLVYHVGDVSFGKFEETKKLLNELNGEIILIRGNHDNPKTMVNYGRFQSIHDMLEINHQGVRLVLCHYPIYEWNQIHRGSIHLHGHVHGRKLDMPDGRHMDVGIDTRNDMGLYSLDDVVRTMLDKPVRCHH